MVAVQNQHIQSYGLQIWQACFQRQFGHDPLKIFRKGGVARVTWPVNFWKISANYSYTVKATDFKFGMHALWDSLHMTLNTTDQLHLFISLLLRGLIISKCSLKMCGKVGESDHDWRMATLQRAFSKFWVNLEQAVCNADLKRWKLQSKDVAVWFLTGEYDHVYAPDKAPCPSH